MCFVPQISKGRGSYARRMCQRKKPESSLRVIIARNVSDKHTTDKLEQSEFWGVRVARGMWYTFCCTPYTLRDVKLEQLELYRRSISHTNVANVAHYRQPAGRVRSEMQTHITSKCLINIKNRNKQIAKTHTFATQMEGCGYQMSFITFFLLDRSFDI